MHVIEMLMESRSIEAMLRAELAGCLREYVIGNYFDWANHPERIGVNAVLVRQKGRWHADVKAYYRTVDGTPDLKVRVRLDQALPDGICARKVLQRIGYRLWEEEKESSS